MKKIAFFFLCVFILPSCKSKLDRLLLSKDTDLKEQKAQEYFENCDYINASPLFKDLIQSYSSSAKVEKVYFYYSYCDYLLEDYLMAAYEFQKILKKFPRGKYAEQSQFLLADCYFKSTPKYNLDQDYNLRASEEFQLFLERFPKSDKREEANQKIEDLYHKREKKAYEVALLYYKMENYQSASSALSSLLTDFPDIDKAEEIRYLIVDAAYKYADKSVEAKKSARFTEVGVQAGVYFKKHADKDRSPHYEEVEDLKRKALENIQNLRATLPLFYIKKKQYNQAIQLLERNYKVERDANTKARIADELLLARYQKSLSVKTDQKILAVDSFAIAYRAVQNSLSEDRKVDWTKKSIFIENLQKELPKTIPYSLYEEGDYKNAVVFFKSWLDTAGLYKEEMSEHLYAYLKAKDQYAQKEQEIEAKKQWDEIIQIAENHTTWKSGKYGGKINALVVDVRKQLETYPLVLITNPIKRKEYALAQTRAKNILVQNKEIENREEVVYLLLLSSVKKAKSVKKYERLPLYEQAIDLIAQYRSQIKDAVLLTKVEKLEAKANKKIKKYENN